MMDLEQIIRSLVERFTYGTRYFRTYVCEVISQSSDLLSLDVRPENSSMAPMENVPIRLGVPGLKAKISSGQTVLLAFENGDPTKPFCSHFAGKTECQELFLDASVKIVFDSPDVRMTSAATAPIARLGDAVSLVVVVAGVPTPCTGSITGASQSTVKS